MRGKKITLLHTKRNTDCCCHLDFSSFTESKQFGLEFARLHFASPVRFLTESLWSCWGPPRQVRGQAIGIRDISSLLESDRGKAVTFNKPCYVNWFNSKGLKDRKSLLYESYPLPLGHSLPSDLSFPPVSRAQGAPCSPWSQDYKLSKLAFIWMLTILTFPIAKRSAKSHFFSPVPPVPSTARAEKLFSLWKKATSWALSF